MHLARRYSVVGERRKSHHPRARRSVITVEVVTGEGGDGVGPGVEAPGQSDSFRELPKAHAQDLGRLHQPSVAGPERAQHVGS